MSNPYLPAPYYSYLPSVLGGQSATAPFAGPGIPMGPASSPFGGFNPTVNGPGSMPFGAGGAQSLAGQVPMANVGSIPQGAGAGDISSLYASQAAGGGMAAAGAGVGAAEGAGAAGGGFLAGLSAPSLANAGGLRALAGGAIAPLAAAYGTNLLLNKALPSTGAAGNVRQTLGDAATGAAIGAGIGAPLLGIGAVPGALIGGAAGGAYGLLDSLFGGDDSTPDYRATLDKSAAAMGLTPKDYTSVYDLYTDSGMDKKQASSLLANQIVSDAQTKRATDAANQQASAQREMDQKFSLAMQSQAQQFFSPYVNNIITAGQAQSELLKGLAAQLPAPYRSVLENQAATQFTKAQQMAGAYAAQSALIPGQFMAQAEQKRQQQLQQLQYQQAVIAAQQGRSGASGGVAGLNTLVPQPGQQQQQPVPTG